MANGVSNLTTIEHSDPSMIERVVHGYNAAGVFNEFIPCPEWIEEPAAARWRKSQWGTTIDAVNDQWNELERISDNAVRLKFDTWSPPYPLYELLLKLGYKVFSEWSDCCFLCSERYDNGKTESLDPYSGIPLSRLRDEWNRAEVHPFLGRLTDDGWSRDDLGDLPVSGDVSLDAPPKELAEDMNYFRILARGAPVRESADGEDVNREAAEASLVN